MRWASVVLALVVATAGCEVVVSDVGGATAGPSPVGVPEDALVTEVVRIVDGDTLVLADLEERLRLIGIDTPETPPGEPPDCYGEEATDHLAALVPPGTEVAVTFDVERADQYDRPLGYLHRTDDGTFVNLAMVADGYASTLTIPPNVRHEDELVAAQREAREAGLGLWGACGR